MCKKFICFVSFVVVLGLVSNAAAQIDPATVETGHVYLLEDVIDVNVPDDSLNDNIGTLVGDPKVVDSPNGKAIQFDGIDDGIFIPDSDFINVNAGPFANRTVIAVFRCDDVTKDGKQTIFEEGGRTRGLVMYVSAGKVYVGGWNRAEYDWNPGSWISAPINSYEWHVVAFVIREGAEAVEDDKFEMWLDGNLIGKAPGGHIHNHGDDNGIGYTNVNTVFHDDDGEGDDRDWFTGAIDEVWILNEALTEDQLGALEAPEPWPFAVGPSPADGELLRSTSVALSWGPGALAVSQDVYLGDNIDDVSAGAGSTFLGSLSTATAGVIVENLEAESTYYWRVDAINDAETDSPWIGDVWSFSIAQLTASEPTPVDGAKFVNPAVNLIWTAGTDAKSHTVYLSDNFDDVNDANDTVAIVALSDPNFSPEEPLAKGTVYYWRVDEFDGVNTHEGDIWSFETPPDIAITDPNLVGWWKLDGEYFDLGYVIDYSGHDNHATYRGDPQIVEGYDGGAMDFDGDGDYINVDGYKGIVVDANGVQQPFTVAAWVKNTVTGDLTIASWGTSTNGIRVDFRLFSNRLRVEHGNGNRQGDTTLNDGEWHHVALTVAEGASISHPEVILWLDGNDDTRAGTDPDTFAITARDDMSIGRRAHNNTRHFIGSLDDVRLYNKVLTDIDMKVISGFTMSTNPEPANGAKVVDALAILSWAPGPFGVEFDVYFGTNPEPGADELVGRVTEATHIVTDLPKGQTYYWRVDDIAADGAIVTGNVWSFRIPPMGAYDPSPADGQEVTDTEADLSWEVDWNPVMYNVYFGTDADQVANAVGAPPSMEIGFDPGSLEPGTTYYWRVDVFYGTWITGEVWSFTVPAPAE